MVHPSWSQGEHSVCVCTSHQNLKLLLDAANLGHQYHDLIDMVVCDTTSKRMYDSQMCTVSWN